MTDGLAHNQDSEDGSDVTSATPSRRRSEACRLGVALGGGGARGLAHVGVLQVLNEAGIDIGALAGASMGAIVGGLYAANRHLLDDSSALRDLLTKAPNKPWGPGTFREHVASLLEAASYLERDLFGLGRDSGMQLESELDDLTDHRNIEDLPLPFAATATDVLTGELVVLRSGKLARAMHASAALPGVFTPVRWGGRWLIDGGVLSNLPVRVARSLGADVTLAVSVTAPLEPNLPHSGLGILMRANAITAHRLQTEELEEAEVPLVLPIPAEIGVFEFDEVDRLIELGRSAAAAALPRLREALRTPPGHQP